MQGRAWNEAYVLRAFLQYNLSLHIVLFNNYLRMLHPAELSAALPLVGSACGSSIWLKKGAV
jgi:hypothetical protein